MGGLPNFTTLLWVEESFVVHFVDDQLQPEVVGLFHIVIAIDCTKEEVLHELDTLSEKRRGVEETAGHKAVFWSEDSVHRSRCLKSTPTVNSP